jgi:hypothetical protein
MGVQLLVALQLRDHSELLRGLRVAGRHFGDEKLPQTGCRSSALATEGPQSAKADVDAARCRTNVSSGMDASTRTGIRVPQWKCHQPFEPKGASTMKITTVGIDLAKNVFQVHGID